MPVPKKRRSHARTRQHHAAWKIEEKNLISCKNCGEANLSHTVCSVCGFYDGKKVMVTKAEKSAARQAAKQEESQA